MFNNSLRNAMVGGAFALMMLSTTANALPYGDYELRNHRGGGIQPPLYGLRLDGLLTGHTWDEYTFSFEGDGAFMEMRYDASGIRIFGQAWGGLDTGIGYNGTGDDAPRLWDIDFTYTAGIIDSGNRVDVQSFMLNSGTIGSDLGIWDLYDYHMDDPILGESFHLAYNHRGASGLSGWGWLNYCQNGIDCGQHMNATDWLFEAKFISEPGSLALLGLGLVAAGMGRRRRG